MITNQPEVTQLADMLKAIGHPLRIQIVSIIAQQRLVSILTLQDQLKGIDQFTLYSNLRYMHKKQIVKKRRKGREIFYGLSDQATAARFGEFFINRSSATTYSIVPN